MQQQITWKVAVVAALQRFSGRHRSLQIERGAFLVEELPAMISATGSAGRTPAQTVSRVLQELRDEGKLFFSESGVYVISGEMIDAVREDFPEDVLDHAARSGKLLLGDVATFDAIGQTRVRRGMAAVRRGTLLNYRGRCALCDITETRLLVTSHIARWSDRPDARGLLANAICLCRMHDPLFECGYFALSDELTVLWRPNISSKTIRTLAEVCTGPFQLPLQHAPALAYLQEHRGRVGL
jgi:hypothetical protein